MATADHVKALIRSHAEGDDGEAASSFSTRWATSSSEAESGRDSTPTNSKWPCVWVSGTRIFTAGERATARRPALRSSAPPSFLRYQLNLTPKSKTQLEELKAMMGKVRLNIDIDKSRRRPRSARR